MPNLRRLVPPAGPRYDLLEIAVVLFAGALLVYVLQIADSSATATLTQQGQRVGGFVMLATSTTAAALTHRPDRTGLAAWILALTAAMWSVALFLGLLMEFRPGSLFFAILYAFFAQWTRKTWGRYEVERECSRGGAA